MVLVACLLVWFFVCLFVLFVYFFAAMVNKMSDASFVLRVVWECGHLTTWWGLEILPDYFR